MRLAVILFVLLSVFTVAHAKRVKTPKSANARAFGQTRKSNGRHAGQKVKVRKKRERYN